MEWRILVLPLGMELVNPAVEAWSLNHWTTREVQTFYNLKKSEKILLFVLPVFIWPL